MDKDNAMFSDYLPVNTIPFLNRMLEILEEEKVNNPKYLTPEGLLRYKKNLWIVMSHTYNQVAKIDLPEEYRRLSD